MYSNIYLMVNLCSESFRNASDENHWFVSTCQLPQSKLRHSIKSIACHRLHGVANRENILSFHETLAASKYCSMFRESFAVNLRCICLRSDRFAAKCFCIQFLALVFLSHFVCVSDTTSNAPRNGIIAHRRMGTQRFTSIVRIRHKLATNFVFRSRPFLAGDERR